MRQTRVDERTTVDGRRADVSRRDGRLASVEVRQLSVGHLAGVRLVGGRPVDDCRVGGRLVGGRLVDDRLVGGYRLGGRLVDGRRRGAASGLTRE